jgi:DNA replication protein DnaD
VFINWVESADVLNEAVRFNTLADADAFEAQFKAFNSEKAHQVRAREQNKEKKKNKK